MTWMATANPMTMTFKQTAPHGICHGGAQHIVQVPQGLHRKVQTLRDFFGYADYGLFFVPDWCKRCHIGIGNLLFRVFIVNQYIISKQR